MVGMVGTTRWARMVFLASMTLGGTVGTSAAAGQGTPPATAEARVDLIFARFDNTRSPGCAVGVVQNGDLILGRGYGMANLEHGLAITPRTVFRIGSVSKQFTAAAVALLAQKGTISLDADVRDYLPEIPAYERPVTVRHLIHHTSGIRDYLVLMRLTGLRSADYYTDAEVLDMLARQEELNFLPGDEHLYSNSGYFLLSQIVLRASGRSLAEYAKETIFDPLGMTHSHYHDDRNHIVSDRATGYAPAGEGFRISVTQLEMVGDGGVFTTVEDLVHWVRNFDEPRVGGASFLETVHTRGRLTNGEELGYAFGLVHGDHRGLRTVSHGGSFVGYRADITTYPDEGLDIITLCNVSDASPTRLARQVGEVFLEDRMGPAPEQAARRPRARRPDVDGSPPTEVAGLVGRYYSTELDTTYEIVVEGGMARVRAGRGIDQALSPAGIDTFTAGSMTFRMMRGDDGRVYGFSVDAGRVQHLEFMRVEGGGP